MKKKIVKIMLLTLVAFINAKNVFAEVIKENYVYYNDQTDNGNYRIHKNINGNTSDLILIQIAERSEGNINGFCVDVGADLPSDIYVSKSSKTLEEYLNTTLNDTEKSKKLATEINEIIYFGYESNPTHNYYAATQKMIWEKLYNAGYRTSYYSNNVTFYYGSTNVNFETETNAINKAIADYKKTPSYCSSTTNLELAVGETATYKDNNGVLSNYKVNCSDGLKCEANGNDLKITVLKESGTQKITFSKEEKGSGTVVYKEGNNQGVIESTGKIASVSCEFGVDTYKNAQTSGIKIVTIISVGIIFGLLAYLIYYKNQMLTNK